MGVLKVRLAAAIFLATCIVFSGCARAKLQNYCPSNESMVIRSALLFDRAVSGGSTYLIGGRTIQPFLDLEDGSTKGFDSADIEGLMSSGKKSASIYFEEGMGLIILAGDHKGVSGEEKMGPYSMERIHEEFGPKALYVSVARPQIERRRRGMQTALVYFELNKGRVGYEAILMQLKCKRKSWQMVDRRVVWAY